MKFSEEITERQLLQSVIYASDLNENSGACDEMLAQLKASDFSSQERVVIFEAMKTIRSSGNFDSGKLFSFLIGKESVSKELMLMSPIATTSDIGYLVKLIRDASTVRIAKREAEVFISSVDGEKGGLKAFKKVSEALANLNIENSGVQQDFSPDKRCSDFFKELEARTKADDEIRGLRTGFPELDKASGGLHGGDLVVIGALPSMGKTTLAMSIAANVILNGGSPAIFSFEMHKYAIDANLVSIITLLHPDMEPVPKWVIENPKGHIRSKQLKHIGEAMAIIKASGALIVDRSSHNRGMDFIRSMCYKKKADGELDLTITDYIGLMVENELQAKEEISGITGGHKKLACDLDVPSLLLTQLNVRDGSKITRPHMGMAKGSGSIEANADLMVFPWRDYVVSKEGDPSEGTLFIDKARAFGCSDIGLRFDTSCVAFQENLIHDPEGNGRF